MGKHKEHVDHPNRCVDKEANILKNKKLTNKDLFKLMEGINKVSDLRGVKFVYCLAKNAPVLEAELEALQKADVFTADYKIYNDARIKICEKFAKKDEADEPVLKDNKFQFESENRKAFNKTMEKLQEEHKKTIDLRIIQEKEYTELMDKPASELDFHKMGRDDLPEDITVAQGKMISAFLED